MTTESIDVLLAKFRDLAGQIQTQQAPAATANKKSRGKKVKVMAVWPTTLASRYLPQRFVDDWKQFGPAEAFIRSGHVRMARQYEREVLG